MYLPAIETDRLVLRKMDLDDARAVYAYASDPLVTRYVRWETHGSLEDSIAFLRYEIEHYEAGDLGDWGIVYKGTGRFVGAGGFMAGWRPEHARAELGYVLAKGYWGRGFMSEAVRAMIRFGFERLDLNRIEARCITENRASARVMDKAGMSREGTLRRRDLVKGEFRDIEIYSILRGEFAGRG